MDQGAVPQVLFVSKPMSPPFRDGSKCLVRDLTMHVDQVHPHVMSTRAGATELMDHATLHAVYSDAGRFAPGLRQNLQAFAWLLGSRRFDLWHSVFAPNPKSSRALSALSRIRSTPVCQTIASPPRHFDHPERLLFGDVVVAQSAWTQKQFLNAYSDSGQLAPNIVEIPPPCPPVVTPTPLQVSEVRRELGLDADDVLLVYPGDLEVSSAARFLVSLATAWRDALPRAKLLIAYRDKTERSAEMARDLQQIADPERVIFRQNVPDILGVLAASSAVLFPVNDLYGKVDLPIVLLEAMALGTPVLVLDQGPLRSLKGALRLPLEAASWIETVAALDHDGSMRSKLVEEGRAAISHDYHPSQVTRAYQTVYHEILK